MRDARDGAHVRLVLPAGEVRLLHLLARPGWPYTQPIDTELSQPQHLAFM